MLRSMTGYGESDIEFGDLVGKVICRSVNHKNLEVRANVPKELAALEPLIVATAKTFASRGRLEIRIDVDRNQNASLPESSFEETAAKLNELAERAGVEPPTFSDIWSVASRATATQSNIVVDEDDLLIPIRSALESWDRARQGEGSELLPTLRALIGDLASCLDLIVARQEGEPERVRARVESRLDDALQKHNLGELEPERLAQELILYVERGAIAEEIQRATSHIQQLGTILEREEPIGKRLDFYLQELFRECNTIGSKTGDIEITNAIIQMKSSVEKLREQAANIE